MASLEARSRTRSPRYPSLALEDAIAHAKKIYDGVHRSAVNSETAFRLMGFAGKSGASATALGSVRQYGLVEGIGENTRITDLALRILEPSSMSEKSEAVNEAAIEPDVFRAIRDRFNDKIPSVDEPIRAFLIREMGFSKSGADECIAALKKTLSYVASLEPDTPNATAPVLLEPTVIDKPPEFSTLSTPKASSEASEVIRLKLSKDCSVELRFNGEVDAKALTSLVRHIELLKEVWEEE